MPRIAPAQSPEHRGCVPELTAERRWTPDAPTAPAEGGGERETSKRDRREVRLASASEPAGNSDQGPSFFTPDDLVEENEPNDGYLIGRWKELVG